MIQRGTWPRLRDWPERLAELVELRRFAPFVWGQHDCMLWGADAVAAMCGVDPAEPWRGTYATEAEAEAILQAEGGQIALIRRALGHAGTVPAAQAQRGDVALVVRGNLPSVGVVLGGVVAAPGLEGLAFLPLVEARLVWMV